MLVGAHQPNFLPWAGYFGKILACDAFVIMDDAQIPRGRSYASRTKIRQGVEERWLSLPIFKNDGQTYRDAKVADLKMYGQHLKVFSHTYGKAPFYNETMALLQPIYERQPEFLIDFNLAVIEAVLKAVGHNAELAMSSDLGSALASSEWLAALTKHAGGDAYLSGPGGASYIDPAVFEAAGVRLQFGKYTPVPYAAPKFDFMPGLSIVDALFVAGAAAMGDVLRYDLID